MLMVRATSVATRREATLAAIHLVIIVATKPLFLYCHFFPGGINRFPLKLEVRLFFWRFIAYTDTKQLPALGQYGERSDIAQRYTMSLGHSVDRWDASNQATNRGAYTSEPRHRHNGVDMRDARDVREVKSSNSTEGKVQTLMTSRGRWE